MSWTNSFKAVAAIATVSVFASISTSFAQEESAADAGAELGLAPAAAEKSFGSLVRCARLEGRAQVLKPRTETWEDAEEGRGYPLGSSFRTEDDATAVFAFGESAKITIEKGSELATREIEIGAQARVVVLKRGKVRMDLPLKLADGLFKVVAPYFECVNLAGESSFEYGATGDGDEAVVRCVTGKLTLNGANYSVPRMGVANQIRIRTTADALFTSIRGESGDCHVMLDKGMVSERNIETGETTDVAKTLEYVLSPKCAVKIFRRKAPIGGRMSVCTMTFSAAGDIVNRFAFAEGRASINSGELVVATTAAAVKKSAKDEDDEDETVDAKPSKDKDEEKAGEDSGN